MFCLITINSSQMNPSFNPLLITIHQNCCQGKLYKHISCTLNYLVVFCSLTIMHLDNCIEIYTCDYAIESKCKPFFFYYLDILFDQYQVLICDKCNFFSTTDDGGSQLSKYIVDVINLGQKTWLFCLQLRHISHIYNI